MGKVTDKVKEKLKGAKDKVTSTTKEGTSTTKEKMAGTKDKIISNSSTTTEQGVSGISSSSEQERKVEEGTAGSEPGRKERARRSGMAKGTAGATETGSEYEQGAAGSNK
jgi:hypothetical protein